MDFALVISAVLFGLFFLTGFLALYLNLRLKKRDREIMLEKEASARRLYELSILRGIGERAGYSLNIEEILSIITGSLRQFIDYSVVAYIVMNPEKLKLHIHLDSSVDQSFITDMKARMNASLGALTGKTYSPTIIDEVVSGAIATESAEQKVGSFFNIPLVIHGELAGILTISHLESGLYKEADMTLIYQITNQASRAVERLQEVVEMEKGKLNAMVESMGDGVVMVNTDYQVVVTNPAARRVVGVQASRKKEFRNVTIFDFIDALQGKFDIRGRLEEAIVKGKSFTPSRISVDNIFYEVGVYPVTYNVVHGNSQKLGAVVLFHDITNEIETEKSREEFTSMIVHELRSPLDGSRKIIELILSGVVKAREKRYKEYLHMIHESSESMLELVNDILDLSKLQANKFEVNKEQTDLKDLIQDRILFYRVSAERKEISLTSSLNDIPSYLNLDPRAIKQVLNNFISNSLKFTPQGGRIVLSVFLFEPSDEKTFFPTMMPEDLPVFPIHTDIKTKSRSICIVVSDTGRGIPQKEIPKLFHTYKQITFASNLNDDSKGTGLGLAIARGIIEAHGGEVGGVSKEGQGSSFFFTIPM